VNPQPFLLDARMSYMRTVRATDSGSPGALSLGGVWRTWAKAGSTRYDTRSLATLLRVVTDP